MNEPLSQASDTSLFSELPVTRSLSRWFVILIGAPFLFQIAVLLVKGSLERFISMLVAPALGLYVFWPISVPLLIWMFIGFIRCLNSEELQSLRLLWLAPLIVLPITILYWGAVFASPVNYRGSQESWKFMTIGIMYLSSIVIAVLAVFQNRGRQQFVIPFSLLSILNTFSCAFFAGLFISGD